ncbi:MAG: nickel pincer cofactor biosynthesis protein LarC [Gemmataceae bacterium]|nr:nickel pincer cofactor biosynthesis protein LarC [Gemmataceae bacterium]
MPLGEQLTSLGDIKETVVRVAHFDCFSGISGNMVLGALLDAGVPLEPIQSAIDSLHLPIHLEVREVQRCGFRAVHVEIRADEQPPQHRYVDDIEQLIFQAAITPSQRELALRILRRLALAESHVHGTPVSRVHLHEVGALDSIADILGAAVGLDLIGVQKFTSRPVPTGRGTVQTAHGLMPIPTPGTLALLQGVPLSPSDVEFELTTPTGAAILTTVVHEYTYTPPMRVERVAYGAGSKNFLDRPNILRLWVGETITSQTGDSYEGDFIAVLETHVDDITPEVLNYCQERLMECGALDVFITQGIMKKGRAGFRITVLANPTSVQTLEEIIFRETGTLGIRKYWCERTKLARKYVQHEISNTALRFSQAYLPDGSLLSKPEYEECARLARTWNVPLRQVLLQCYSRIAEASRIPSPASQKVTSDPRMDQDKETKC